MNLSSSGSAQIGPGSSSSEVSWPSTKRSCLNVDARVAAMEDVGDPAVLLEDTGREDELEAAVTPGLEDLARDAAKEDARHQDVGVEDSPHFLRRTSAIPASMSSGVSPADSAAFRASRIS